MQPVNDILDALALKVVLLGRLEPAALLPLLEPLNLPGAPAAWLAELAGLRQLLAESGDQPQEKYAAFGVGLERLRRQSFADTTVSAPAAAAPVISATPAAPVLVSEPALAAAAVPAGPATGLVRYDQGNSADILNHFFLETTAHLQTVEQSMLKLEADLTDKALLTNAFGALHSLKGVCGFLDLNAVRDLVHAAEALVEAARRRASGATRGECDLLLRTVDVARGIIDQVRGHAQTPGQPFPALPASHAALMAELQGAAAASTGPSQPASADAARNATPAAAAPAVGVKPVVVAEPVEAEAGLVGGEARGETRVVRADRRETDQPAVASTLVRVHVEKLDRLIDAIGELAIAQIQIFQNPLLQAVQDEALTRNVSLAGKITRELQTLAMTLRMVPLRETFGRMARLARDLAHRQGKEIAVVVEGEETEMDKSLIELLVDPLTHLVRNAVDHGVAAPAARRQAGKAERATLRLAAYSQGGHVVVEVGDDGAGLDFAKILSKARQRGWVREGETPEAARLQQFIFEAGFSTAEKITDVSGRGIGLDVVRGKAASAGGRVTVRSAAGEGTTFTIILPLTLSILDGLLVQAGSEQFILPMTLVVESLRPTREQLGTVHERGETLELRGRTFPLIRLADYAGIRGARQDPTQSIVIVVESRGEEYALQVDDILGVQQVVIKGLGERLQGMKGISGGAILGDGRVRLILDIAGIRAASRQATMGRVG